MIFLVIFYIFFPQQPAKPQAVDILYLEFNFFFPANLNVQNIHLFFLYNTNSLDFFSLITMLSRIFVQLDLALLILTLILSNYSNFLKLMIPTMILFLNFHFINFAINFNNFHWLDLIINLMICFMIIKVQSLLNIQVAIKIFFDFTLSIIVFNFSSNYFNFHTADLKFIKYRFVHPQIIILTALTRSC